MLLNVALCCQVTLAAWQEFDSQQAAVREFVGKVRSVTEREMNFSSPESLSTELEQTKDLLKQCETEGRLVNTLLKRAAEIQLGPKNQSLLLDQARSLSEQVDKVEAGLKRDVKTLEGMKDQWDSFGSEFEAFSTWITEREREMDSLKSSNAPLDQQICTIKTIREGLQERSEVLSNLEEKSQTLVQFMSSGESARIKARLTQIGRYWEELKESVEHLDGQLEESSSHQTKFNANLQQVQSEVEDIQKKLDSPVISCVSSSETYKTLQSHMDMFQSLEKLKATLLSLCAGARRLSEREKAEKAVAALQESYEQCLKQAKKKQNQMESLLSHWQKYEKDWSALQSCLERCDSASSSDTQFLTVDKQKLNGELLELKHLQSELQSLESVYNRLEAQTPTLYTTASDEHVKTLKEAHEQLEKRWKCQTTAIPNRIQVLQEHRSQVEQFDQALQKFFKWGESFLSSLNLSSHIDVTDLQPSTSDIKERRDDLQKQSSTRQSLQQQTKVLCDVCEPAEVQQLQGKWESSLQPYLEAHQLVDLRGESLEKLEAFLHTHSVAAGVLQGLRHTVESAGSWDKSRVDELQRDLEAIVPDIGRLETLAVNLDGSLCKAHLHLINGKETRSSCRSLADSLSVELDAVRNLLGSKQSEAEALGALWSSFRQRKEQLLKTVEDIEEKADQQGLKEPNVHTLQQRLRFFNQLEDELQSHQQEEQWLRDKGQQLAQRDAELGGEVLREISLLQTTWEDTKKLITERQEQSSALVDLMKDYQSLKSSINTILESADAIADIKAVLKDQEDTRRSLLKHEAVKTEMAGNQDVLERFSSKGKKLLSELNKIPECDAQIVKTETDATVDQWLDVSEKIEDNLESLKRSSALWVDIYSISGEIESWSNSSVMDLTDGLNNFNDSQKTANKLSEVKVDVGLKEKKIDALQEKVSELKQLCGGHDVPAKLQVMETDLRRKISSIEELCDQAKSNLQDFCSQKKQLEDFLTQMSEWLMDVERSLVDSPCGTAPEEICRVKEIQKELQNQQTSIDSARESLNTLCRKYPSEELAGLGSSLTDLIKKYDTVNQLCVKKLGSMQHGLQQNFNDLVKEFHTWLSGQKDIVRECADHSGDMSVVERKLQKLKGALERVDDGDSRLTLVCTEGEKLLLHLPKASAGQVQQNLSSIQQDWDSYVEQCKQNQQNLEDSASLLSGFESCLQRLTRWLERMDVRMSTELPEGRHSDQEKVTLERVEEFQHEVLKERDSFESLCQEAQALSEGGHGSGAEVRASAQLQLQHQALLKAARERLRVCQLSQQEQQNFEETLQGTWGWLSGVQERLNTLNSTSGNKETLEKRLGLVQDILLMKGEGEVKLNMTVGKGEQVLKNCSRDKQEVIRSQLKSLKDSWANILMTAMSCHSRLEWTVAQWGCFLESKAQLQQWMEMVEQEAGVALPQQPGLKEKASLLERLRAIQADVEVHSSALTRLNEKASEMYEKTGDQAFAEGPKSEFNTQFTNITSVIKSKVQQMEEMVKEHEQYVESVRDLNDWLTSAKEELQRWSDMSGDAASVQRKLSKVRGLLDSKNQGRERLTRVQSCGAATRDHTSTVGCEVLEREEAGMLSAWEQWERGAKHVCSGLEGVLSQMANSEQEFNSLAAQLEQDLQEFSSKLQESRFKLLQVEEMTSGEEAVQGWQIAKDTLEALLNVEPMSDNLKCQLNDLCRFSRDLGAQSERVSTLIKEYNSLSLQASRECQGKEKLLEQRFRAAFRDFQQWLVNAKINTAKCFDVPQNLAEASSSLQKIQEFLSDREQGHGKLNTVAASGELLMSIISKDRVESVRAKINTTREDWKTLMTNLHQRETALQNLQSQMRDFETSVEPLQDWLNETEEAVRESNSRLHDLTAKKQELHRLQSLLEELASKESQLHRLREKAQQLWDGHTAGKGFVHRVSQLSAQYLALSNLTKEKASRIDRIVSEHQLFSQGLKELQNWVADTSHMLQTYCTPTADKNVLDSRMIKLEALLTARQEKEIQLKMLLTRGESVQRNTSAEGVNLVHQQIEDLKDSWDGLLSASIQCKSQLEGALSQWTSYQEDVRQFVSWMETVEETLNSADKQCSEMRDKTTNLGKAKLLSEDVLSHSSVLDVISMKGSNMAEHYVTQLEIQDLQERYNIVKNKAQCAVAKAEELVSGHQVYQSCLHEFKDWLEQQQERLSCYTQLEGDVETLEVTLRKLQELQVHCTEGHALLNTLLVTREQVIPWGVPQLEDRCLETVQQEWGSYQTRLGETRSHLNSALAKLRQIEQKFQRLDNWLKGMETKGQLRSGRRSDRGTKEAQLHLLKGWHEEVLAYQEEIEGLSVLAQQVLEEMPISSRVSARATQLTSRYHALLLHLQDTIKQLKEEMSIIEESQSVFSTFSDWLSTAQKNFSGVTTTTIDVVDRVSMEKKMKKLEALQGDMELGHTFLKTMREKTDRAMTFLEEPEAEQLKEEVDTRLSQLEALIRALRSELSATEKSIQLSKDFLDKYKTQSQWLSETKSLLGSPVEPKAELYQKKAQLAKYKTIQQTIQSHESAVKSVIEKGDALLETIRDPSVSENIGKLKADYQDLCKDAKVHVRSLTESVREHEDYNCELQEVEKWLLQMSSRLVTSDSTQSGNLETATQQLARHKAIMEEIAGFEERLSSLKDKGERLASSCTEQVQAKIRQQIQAHQQGTRDSYSAICSTTQRVYQSLDRELQKHVSHQDTLQQCQTWLSSVKDEIQLQTQTPYGLQEALKQVKHFRALQEQASTYLDLVCSVCDLSDESVRATAAKIQQTKTMIEERMTISQELSDSWREIKEQKQELATLFQDMEQQLQSLSRRPAELELKIAQNMLDQAKEFGQHLQSRQSTLTKMTELVSKLTEGKESPEHTEIGRLTHAWLELCHQANKLHAQREEDLQRTKEYHDCISAMEALFEQVSKEWDNLARTDAESSSDHLEALRKLSVVLKEKINTLDDLKEQKQKVMYHLNLDDKELVKEQIGHFEQRWAHLESLIERKIQDSVVTLEDMGQVEARLREAREWAEEQQPALSEAMKMSPPPELAQSFLFDHLTICSELEVKQLLLAQAMSDADRVLAHLGLNERQRLQQLISETQAEVESLSVKVAQRRKHLSKAFTERTQFLLAVNQAITWVQQNEKKAQAEDYIALLPDDLSKQVRTSRNIQTSLRAYQSELTSLWSQGRDLMKDASEEEKSEMLNKLQELQNTFEVALQKCSQRLQELEKVLVTRKYFKVDLEKICQWLKQADIVTFPEINLMNGDAELSSQLTKYQQILDQAMEYENLLLTVQRTGQEILPTLNEVDHCYLDEKLIALPQQYNNILGLAKEKQEKIQQAILARQEYASFIDITHKALKELEEQFYNLGTQSVSLKTEEVVSLLADYKALQEELTNLGQAVSELNQKKEGFRSTGQPWRPEEMTQLVSLYNGLKRLIEQRVEHLEETLESFEDHQAMAMQVDSELKATKEQLVKVNAETQSAEERLKNYHSLAASLQGASSHLTRLMEQMDNLVSHMDTAAHEASKQRVTSWQEELQSLQSAVGELIVECENRFVQSKDFETEVNRTLTWLQQIKDELGSEVMVDVKIEKVQEEIRKQQIMQEEVQSRLRIVAALSTREKQKYTSANELVPAHVDSSLQEMAKLEADVQRALSSKQITLEQALGLCQKYHSRMQTACEWLEDAVGFLQQASLGVDVENYEECLRQQEDIMATEQEFLGVLEELESLPPQLENLVNPTSKEQLRLSVESAQQRGVEVRDQLQCHQDILNSCVAQWNSYQEARQTAIELMNEAEKKLTEFSTAKAATGQEAEEKLRSHKSLVSMVNSFQEKLTGLEEQASQLELIGSDASKATISRSMTTVWQRWTRLRSVARGQERVLEDTAHEWRTFREKMMKVRAVTEELKSRIPDCTVEKASKATLQSHLDQYELVAQDLEREQSSLTLLRQYALSLLHDVEVSVPTADHEQLPSLMEIKAVQDKLESLLQKARTAKTRVHQELSDREGVERGLSLVKSWIQDSRELLLNPTSDLDILTQELEVMHGELITHRQKVDKLAEQQQSKYLDLYTILPSEISMQLAEVSLALGSIEDQVQAKERDIQKTRVIKEEFNSRIHDVSEKLKAVSSTLKEKATDIDQAKDEARRLCDELDGCGRNLAELEAAVQDFGRRNPLIARQLADAIAKLREIHHHTLRLAEYKTIWLKKAEAHLDEYNEMFEFIVKWTDRARSLVKANIIWNSSSHLQEQIRMYQSVLRESRELHGDMEAMQEKVEILSETLQVEAMGQQASELSRHTEELEQSIRSRLQSLQDAAKDMERFENEVKALHVSLEQVQATLTSPELARLSLKEQLTQRQRLLADMESFKQQVEDVQECHSGLRVPEEVVTSLSICRTALNLQHEASQLQHTAIQQCNILQEAVVQYEQYEQEVRNLQAMIEDAHRVIQDQPVNTSNIQELQAQINHHEELAHKIKGYQEQIASLNSKCKMLTVKAKHATTLLTVSDAEGLTESLEELDGDAIKRKTQSQVSMSMGRATLTRAPLQELYNPTLESVASLDDLQRSWETLKNVISEKQKTLYEALEKQQRYQGSLQSISTKMESIETRLLEPPMHDLSPDRQMLLYQNQMEEIVRLQDDIDGLQSSLTEELMSDVVESDSSDQLAMQSTLTVLAERMATIHMKASGKRQLLEERQSERVEKQQQAQALQSYLNQADQLDQWLRSTRGNITSCSQDSEDMEEQLRDCQNMLLEIEEKVLVLSELSRHSETLLLEGRPENREDAEQLSRKLRTLKGSLLELQRMLQDKQINIQDSLQEPSDSSESDSSLSQSPNMQDWLAQARSTRSLQHQDTLQKQKELEEQLAEQKKLLKSLASRGEEILTQQASPVRTSATETLSPDIELEGDSQAVKKQRRKRWESLKKDMLTKLQLLMNTLEQDSKQPFYSRTACVKTAAPVYKRETHVQDKSSLMSLHNGFSQTVKEITPQATEREVVLMEQQLYSAVTASSSWVDDVENTLFSGPALLTENAETQLSNYETLGKEVTEVTRVASHSQGQIASSVGLSEEEQTLMKDTLDCLTRRLGALDSALDRRCDTMRSRMRELTAFQTELQHLFTAISESKFQVIQKMAGVLDHTTTKQLETIAEVEETLKDFEHRITELKARGAELHPDQFSTNELLKLQDAYEELVMTVGSRRSGLNQNMALKNQYERVLQDLIDLVDTAQDKMTADQKMIASSVEDVHSLLDKHKEFFQGLEWHMVLTETFYKKISAFVLPRERQTLEETLARAQDVLKQAHKKGVELECISETWSRLVLDYQTLYRLLEAVEGSLPRVGLVEETEERLKERIELYQALKASLMENQNKLHQVLEEGKHLLSDVSCSSLENQLTLLGEHWLNNSTKINKELHNLDSILKHSTRYKHESVELSRWLQEALERLEFWNTQTVAGPQELETVKDQLSAFLEFSKEVETRSSLKASVLNEGNQLLRLKKMDTASLRSELTRLDSQWSELLARIPIVQEKLHQSQMDKLASCHAISELVNWISLMERVIEEDEENLKGAVGSKVIQEYLQRYKGFRVDVNCKQLTVDFVNQSVLQISGADVESKRSDKTDFAEKLGTMNCHWQILQTHITERMQYLEGLLASWVEYEGKVQGLQAWLNAQEDRLKRKHRIENLSSVQNALKDCQEMEEMVKEKERELERVEEQACALVQNKTDEACAVVMESLQALNNTWANLDHLIGQLKISLKSFQDKWSQYKQASEEINGYLTEGRYSVSRYRLLTGSLEASRLQVESLQNLQEELEKQESSLRKFGSVTHQLLEECHPSVSDTLNNTLKDINARWNSLQEEIVERLKSSKGLLQLWQSYKDLYGQSDSSVQTLEERANQMLKTASHKDITEEEVSTWIQDCAELLRSQAPIQASLQVLLELGAQLKQQVDTSAVASIQSDHLSLTQRLSAVEQSLSRQQVALQVGVRDYETFNEQLHSLSRWIVEAEEVLKGQDPNGSSDLSLIWNRMEELKKQMLKFSSMSPDVERLSELGYRLPLNDSEIKRMQNLNRSWSTTSAQTTERFSKLQALILQQQTFLEKCETWMEFLEQTEEKLTVEISGNFQSLMEQQRAHELFQAEMFSRQQILHSIISDGQRMLEQGQVDDRDEFKLKLALLSNQWQGVVRRAQQRRGIIDSLLRQWQRYREMGEKLRKWLVEVSHQAVTLQAGAPVPLQQARAMLDAVQLREKVLLRQQGSYILTVEAGRQLLLSADSRAEAALQDELLNIQERWRHANICLEEQKKELAVLLRDWERCEKGIGGSLEKLRAFKRQLSQTLPDRHEELQSEQLRCKDLESKFDGWKEDLTHLTVLRESLCSYISPEDLRVLQERTELLHRQWEEICHQLCLRRQQVSEKLNEWAIFNDKYKELCEWLTQMESKVSQNGDVSIEEMIEKLRKDYQEEVAVAQENKHELTQLGERLARASHESKASDIEHKLGKVSERWQHLVDLIGARAKKLRETLVAIQQLDKNMNSLRTWLAHIETELSRPIVYDTCDYQEIQRKLDLQQELQRDIEKHSTGVASVLNLCEVLLHDCDACATDAECDSIQQATRNLDRRWRSICAMSMERRLKIEETWRLWQKFLDDFSHFEEWLMMSEKTAALPNSSGVLYTVAKEELKKFETFQRQVHEGLTQLELINKQYQRLARENRTDASCSLREMAHDANQRWDNLQRRVLSVLRRLKHFICQREEFETARDCILVWLTEMDLQLTNIEHFSECDVQAKIKQLRAFQQEITLNTGKIDHIFQQGEALLEKSEPIDAAVIEEELEELQRYCQEVFGRVERYYKKLIRLPLTDDEHDVSYSDREFDLDEPGDVSSFPWSERLGDGFLSPLPSSSRSASLAAPLRAERSGRDTPASVDSIPLEWDHDYDLSRGLESASRALSSEPGDQGEDGYLQGSASALSGDTGSLETHIRQLDKALNTSCFHLQQTENIIRSRTPTGPELDATYMGYMRLLEECRGSIDAVKRVGFELKEEDDKTSGFVNPNSSESQTSGVIERWELLQAQALSKEMRMKQNMQQWQQFNTDLNSVCRWMDQTEEELEQQRGLDLSTDIHSIEIRIKKLKELQKALDKRKAIVLSINLCSAEFVQSDSEEARDLQRRLKEMNNRWERLSGSLDEWRNALQHALMQCQDFHEMSHGLLLWLENIDRRRNEIVPIDHTRDSDTLQEHHKTLLQIRRELLDTQLKLASLQDMSLQLLVHSEGSDCLEAKEKVHVIGNRLKLLLKEVTRDIRELQKTLDITSSQQDLSSWSSADELDTSGSLSPVSGRSTPSRQRSPRGKSSLSQPGACVSSPLHSRSRNAAGSGSSHSEEEEPPSWCKSFLKRVLWAALPLQIILLLLVVVACLVPTSEEDYSCAQLNNFARSFHPMLSYTNGPPPI
ncbi:nesprin-1 [Pimephales promelas]|nr:nesprin-1 [Pimephales promelas]